MLAVEAIATDKFLCFITLLCEFSVLDCFLTEEVNCEMMFTGVSQIIKFAFMHKSETSAFLSLSALVVFLSYAPVSNTFTSHVC